MRVLITGAFGFLGTAVYNELSEQHHELLAPSKSDLNFLDGPAVVEFMNRTKPDAVIHLAAVVGGIGANMENPGRFFYENMQMGINAIHAAMLTDVPKFVMCSTTCAYPHSPPHIPFRTEDLWSGYPEKTNAPYGIAKKALSVMGDAYRQQYGLNFVTVIPTNLFGQGDDFDPRTSHVIPAVIRKFKDAVDNNQDTVTFWGDGSATRDFLYVYDAARYIRLTLENYNDSKPINLGSGKEVSIKELVEKISSFYDFRGDIIWDTTKPNGQPRRCLSIYDMKLIGVSLDENGLDPDAEDFDIALKDTIDWWEMVHEDF